MGDKFKVLEMPKIESEFKKLAISLKKDLEDRKEVQLLGALMAKQQYDACIEAGFTKEESLKITIERPLW